MRTLGIVLFLLAAISGLFGVFHRVVPFRIPLAGDDALYWALVLAIAGAVAMLAALGARRR
jgi:hypothetical protein